MPLKLGARLGPYEILSPIGAGGMGEVYRATDTNLKRAVAIKVLPASVASDPERLARFQREAEVLASLNHPNIAAIYGLEKSDGTTALVMELVEGEDLSQRIARGPIPVDEALPMAKQIAEALEAAHEQGIIHRDLKPANIKVRPDGTVKVLDFGLAKLAEASAGAPSTSALSLSPTITSPALMTGVGVLLGTAAYMAPEQAKGKPADKRTDIWGFGCVFFEMLTGTCPFHADEVSDTLAMVLMKEPDWSRLPPSTPTTILTLLRRSLEKDRSRRLPSIGAARLEIEESRMSPPASLALTSTPSALMRAFPWVLSALMALVAIALAVSVIRTPRVAASNTSVRFDVDPPSGLQMPANYANDYVSLALSPDGRQLAFVAEPRVGARSMLAVRVFSADNALVLAGTEGAYLPFWSPDGRFVAFFADGKLKRIDVSGGPAQIICNVPTPLAAGGTWSTDGIIVFAPNPGGLLRVNATGGAITPATDLDATRQEVGHTHPFFLPDGRHFLFLATSPQGNTVRLGSLDARTSEVITASESKAAYAAGQLLFMREGALLALPFDAQTLKVSGEARAVAQDISFTRANGAAAFSVSPDGSLAYRMGTAASPTQLTVVDRNGKPLRTFGMAADLTSPELSPDGSRLAVSVLDPSTRTRDIWIHDLRRDIRSRFTVNAGEDYTATWSPDGTRLAYSASRSTPYLEIYQRLTNGAGVEERLLQTVGNRYVTSWSPDGRYILLYSGFGGSATGNDLWILPTTEAARTPQRFLASTFNEEYGAFSPDGRWVAYEGDETGRRDIYVVPFPGPGGKWQISTGGGEFPRWRRDGKELFYVSGGNTIMSVAVNGSGDTFDVGPAQRLFEARLRTDPYLGFGTGDVFDVFPDGQQFIVNVTTADQPPSRIRMITNWISTLK
jgi:serine/threonine protein kinase